MSPAHNGTEIQAPDTTVRVGTSATLPQMLAAFSVTLLDGFDAFSLSLSAPAIAAARSISPAEIGSIFTAAAGGMIFGSIAGGVLADRQGPQRILLAALILFGSTALMMPLCMTTAAMAVNRALAGVGLGAAAPVAVALLNTPAKRPSNFTVCLVWSGIPIGGVLASAFSYFVVPELGWASIFLFGGVLQLPIAFVVARVFRSGSGSPASRSNAPKPFRKAPLNIATLLVCLMFLFGYVTTSTIANWLPTILNGSGASPAMIAVSFAAINFGGAIAQVFLGLASTSFASPRILPACWLVTGCLAIAAAMLHSDAIAVAILCIFSAILAAGSQGLSVAIANRASAGHAATSVGLAVGTGRIGQFAALGLSSAALAAGSSLHATLVIAGIAACIAAGVAVAVSRIPRIAL